MSEMFEVDINNDGFEDTVAVEQYGDGGVMVTADTNGDGLVDVAALDVDGDGTFDAIAIDSNYDGTADETYAADGSGGYASV